MAGSGAIGQVLRAMTSRVAEERALRRGARRARQFDKGNGVVRLDLGGGDSSGTKGWLNIDVTGGADIHWDLRRGIPFSDGRVESIYSSHLLEHMPFADGQALLAEAYRVLAPGGTISICVPNAEMYLRAYTEGQQLPSDFFTWSPAVNGTTQIDMVNYVAYMGGAHAYMFDIENLICRLELVGFTQVHERAFDPAVDLQERAFESIYAIGHKGIR